MLAKSLRASFIFNFEEYRFWPPFASCVTLGKLLKPLCLNFFICEMEVVVTPVHRAIVAESFNILTITGTYVSYCYVIVPPLKK